MMAIIHIVLTLVALLIASLLNLLRALRTRYYCYPHFDVEGGSQSTERLRKSTKESVIKQ